MNKISKAILCVPAAALLAPAVCYMPFVFRDAFKKYDDDCDYLMILGSVIIGEDTPSTQLTERMERAAEYLKNHPSSIAVPCGGCFRKEQRVSEAQIIKNYLIKHGIDENRIILEDKSTTTYENFEFATEIIKEHAEKPLNEIRIAYLTSDYHIFRSGVIAGQSGIENVLKVNAKSKGKSLNRFLREYFVSYDLAYRTLFK